MGKASRLARQLRQQELLKNFEGDYYQEKRLGDKWLVKHQDGSSGRWVVAEYSKESFYKYKEFNENKARFNYNLAKD